MANVGLQPFFRNYILEQAPIAFVAAFCAPDPCDVYVDGRSVGETPLKSLEIPSDKPVTVQLRRGATVLQSRELTLEGDLDAEGFFDLLTSRLARL